MDANLVQCILSGKAVEEIEKFFRAFVKEISVEYILGVQTSTKKNATKKFVICSYLLFWKITKPDYSRIKEVKKPQKMPQTNIVYTKMFEFPVSVDAY